MSGGFGEGIREIAALRARRRAGERSAPPLTRVGERRTGRRSQEVSGGNRRAPPRERLRERHHAGKPGVALGADLREADLPHREEGLSEIPGAGFHEIGGERVFAIVRPVDELLPGRDLHDELRSALARLDSVKECDLYRGLRPAQGHAARDVAVMDLASMLGRVVSAEPYQENGKLVGYRITPKQNPEILEAQGIVAGDIITRVNNIQLNSQKQGIRALRNAVKAQNLEVMILRDGVEVPITISLAQ